MGDFLIHKHAVIELIEQGVALREISRSLNLPYSTVQLWSSQLKTELSVTVQNKPIVIAHSKSELNRNNVAVELLQTVAEFYGTELILTSDFSKLDLDWSSNKFLFHPKYLPYQNAALTALASKRKLGQHILALSPFMRLETLSRLLTDTPSFVVTTGTVDNLDADCGGIIIFPDGYFVHLEVGYEGAKDTPTIHWIEKSGDSYYAKGREVTRTHSIPEITFGDLHHPYQKNFDINKGNALHQIFHDISDNNPISRHNAPHTWTDAIDEHRISLQALLSESRAEELFIVESNHDYWINNFLRGPVDPSWKKPLVKLYHKLNLILLDKGDLNEWLYGTDPRISIINHKKNTIVNSAIHGLHGHKKSRFEKNTLPVLNGLGLAIILGHTHMPRRNGRVYYAGTSAGINPSYGGMLGGFAQGDVVKFANGVFANWVNHRD